MPQVGPTPVEVVPFGLGWVRTAIPPHQNNSLGLCEGPLLHRQVSFCPSQELGPSRHFPLLAVGIRSPQQLQTSITSTCSLRCMHATTPSASTLCVDADGHLTCPVQACIKKVMHVWTSAVPGVIHRHSSSRALFLGSAPLKFPYLLAPIEMFLSILESGRHKLRIAHGLTLVTPRRRSQRPGPSSILGSLGPSHQQRHTSRISLQGPPCAHGVSGTSYGEVHDIFTSV